MATPSGMRCIPRTLPNGDRVHVYSDATLIVLQVRHQVPSEDNILEPAYKSAVSLTPLDAIAIAKELLEAAATHLSRPSQPEPTPLQRKKKSK